MSPAQDFFSGVIHGQEFVDNWKAACAACESKDEDGADSEFDDDLDML